MWHVVHRCRVLPLSQRRLMGSSSVQQHGKARANSAESAWRRLCKCMKKCNFSIIRRSPSRSNPYRVGQIWGHRQASASKILPGGNHADSGRFDADSERPDSVPRRDIGGTGTLRGRSPPNQPEFESLDLVRILEAKRRKMLAKNTALLWQ